MLLKYQDRSLWHRPLIRQGNYFLELATQEETSVYHLEAAIAWLHATAPSFEATNWKAIYRLYTLLHQQHPTPIVALNKAIAAAYAVNKQTAISELDAIKGLENYHLYHTAVGEIYFDWAHYPQAEMHFQKALKLTASLPEQQLLQKKIAACTNAYLQ